MMKPILSTKKNLFHFFAVRPNEKSDEGEEDTQNDSRY